MRKAATGKLSLRVPPDVLKRADGLRSKVSRDPSVNPLGQVTRSTVLKLALMRGLDELEKQYR